MSDYIKCGVCDRYQDASNRFACHRPQGETRECYETAIIKLRGRASMLDQELRQYRRENGEQITITLDGYERANLLWLIGLIGYQGEALPPFDVANTGDWVGQIYWKVFGESGVQYAPNVTRKQVLAEINTTFSRSPKA